VRKHRTKILFIVASAALALYFLYPTYRDYELQKSLSSLTGADSLSFIEEHDTAIRENRLKRIKLGLDLQGGMRVVLEVNLVKLLEDLAKNKDETFAAILKEAETASRSTDEDPALLLRRSFESREVRMSRYYGNLRDSNDEVTAYLSDESKKAIDRAMEIVRNRVDQYGVSEPSIQKLGGTRIIVELPGVSKEDEVRQLLQGTALLEFKLLKEPEVVYRIMDSIDKLLAAADSTSTDTAKTEIDTTLASADNELSAAEFARKHPFFSIAIINPEQFPGEAIVLDENREKLRRILERDDVRRVIPNDLEFVWSARARAGAEGSSFYTLYPVIHKAELTGGVITDARETIDPTYNQPIVTMQMTTQGARDWARITGANINKRIAIILDNSVFSAPVVRSKITGGNSQIEGMATLDEARLLAIVLKAGALPAPVDIVEQRTVGPSLGEDSIRAGLVSSGIATLLTILFMAFYYRTGGLVANMALLFCILFILAVLAGFQGTLTLPGIAGIILTLAIAVDANVLIYERIREESETGKTLRSSIDAGYNRAWTAIIDSNVTTFITGLILYQFGSGPVQGFALTLMIGIVASLLSAFFFTRWFFEMLTERKSAAISFG